MKVVFPLLLILLFNNAFSSKAGREFYQEFLRVTFKDDMKDDLSEQCFGNLFDYYFLVFKMSYHQNDFVTLLTSFENIIYDSIFLNCRVKAIKNILENINVNLTSSQLTSLLYSNAFKLGKILFYDLFSKNITGASLGRVVGKIYNIFRKNYTEPEEKEEPVNEIAEKAPLNADDYFGLIEGLFLGMKKEEDGKESLCYKDVMKGKDEIMKHVKKGMKGVEEGKTVGKMVRTILFNLMTVEGLVLDCNLLTLGGSVIAKLTSMKELTVLGDKILKNLKDYIKILEKIFSSLIAYDLKNLGFYFGKLISAIFDFYVK